MKRIYAERCEEGPTKIPVKGFECECKRKEGKGKMESNRQASHTIRSVLCRITLQSKLLESDAFLHLGGGAKTQKKAQPKVIAERRETVNLNTN